MTFFAFADILLRSDYWNLMLESSIQLYMTQNSQDHYPNTSHLDVPLFSYMDTTLDQYRLIGDLIFDYLKHKVQ